MFFLWSCNILGNQQRHGVATTARAHAIEVIKNNSSPLTLDCELAGENANFTWSTPSIVFALPCDNTVIVIRWTVLQWKIKRINWIETGFKFVIKQQRESKKKWRKGKCWFTWTWIKVVAKLELPFRHHSAADRNSIVSWIHTLSA